MLCCCVVLCCVGTNSGGCRRAVQLGCCCTIHCAPPTHPQVQLDEMKRQLSRSQEDCLTLRRRLHRVCLAKGLRLGNVGVLPTHFAPAQDGDDTVQSKREDPQTVMLQHRVIALEELVKHRNEAYEQSQRELSRVRGSQAEPAVWRGAVVGRGLLMLVLPILHLAGGCKLPFGRSSGRRWKMCVGAPLPPVTDCPAVEITPRHCDTTRPQPTGGGAEAAAGARQLPPGHGEAEQHAPRAAVGAGPVAECEAGSGEEDGVFMPLAIRMQRIPMHATGRGGCRGPCAPFPYVGAGCCVHHRGGGDTPALSHIHTPLHSPRRWISLQCGKAARSPRSAYRMLTHSRRCRIR